MVHVLQEVADMAVNFERSRGYSLLSFEVNHTPSYNNHNSNQLYRSSKPSTKETPQPNLKLDKLKCWHFQGNHLKKDCPTVPCQSNSLQSKPNSNKDKQCKLIKFFPKKKRFQKQKGTSEQNYCSVLE